MIALAGLEDKADDRIGSLSGGQRRRIDLGIGIIGWPELLYLDEPTTGFDPAARRAAWDLIESLVADGATVLLTTHYLEEAERLADRVAIIATAVWSPRDRRRELTARIGNTRIGFDLPSGAQQRTWRDQLPSGRRDVNGTERRVRLHRADDRPPPHHGMGRGAGCRARAPRGHPVVAGGRVPPARPGVRRRCRRARRRRRRFREARRRSTREPVAIDTSRLVCQIRYQLLTFVRTPIALFFTIVFPLMFFVLINTVFGGKEITTPAGRGRRRSSSRVGWRRSPPSRPPTPISPTWCRSAATRA